MKKLLLLCSFVVLLSSCEDVNLKTNGNTDIQKKSEEVFSESNKQIGLPAIKNFQEKKIMKEIYESRDNANLICYAYFYNTYTGSIGAFIGKCIGYGLPYATQFSNPSMIWDAETHGGVKQKFEDAGEIQVIPQPEPNGLYMPESTAATWLLLIDPTTNKSHAVYIEPDVIVSPFPLK